MSTTIIPANGQRIVYVQRKGDGSHLVIDRPILAFEGNGLRPVFVTAHGINAYEYTPGITPIGLYHPDEIITENGRVADWTTKSRLHKQAQAWIRDHEDDIIPPHDGTQE